ncbi:SMAD/FHA domain-containing protein [Mytilinidion resinicola]|uniref:SMAD/FHA domain-containing protein n=1 Tax=Mytilinidion resinicola TaxID=574789 RepID=A0A6A6Z460_9PEZI|nr:SMAD/FHA domain-containing protein [Mytilinidion resinicola]KAF2815074.1 SMAD/FHA domain-containing protein [Mytilinidion resinicola]
MHGQRKANGEAKKRLPPYLAATSRKGRVVACVREVGHDREQPASSMRLCGCCSTTVALGPGDEAARPRTGTRRSRSRSRDRPRDQPRVKGSAKAASPARSGLGGSRDRRIRESSPPRRRRGASRDRYTSQKERRPRDSSRDRKPRSRSRERRPKDTATEKELNLRDVSRDHRPRRRSRSRERSRDRSRDRRKRRHSRSRSPYRASKRRDRSASPRRRTSRSPSHKDRRVKVRNPSPPTRSRKPLPSQEISFRGGPDSGALSKEEVVEKQKPNLAPSGLLAREANTVAGTNISLKYHEPPEARKPLSSAQWRIFVFKGEDTLDTIELYTRSVWLLGRAPEVADILLAHPSSSQQHAAIQFRYIVKKTEDEYGVTQKKGKVKPYIIDLESSNGTVLNGEKLDAGRYVELRDGDLLKFGGSEREYVIMLPPPDKG